MSKLETLRDGLIDELKDIFSAENQLLKALPKMAKKASDEKLKAAFTSHLEETKGQIERLQQIAEILDEKLSGKTCKAMQGLIEEGKEVIEEESENEALLDALLIGAAQRVEHYEMAAYSTACAMAKQLGESEVVKHLMATLAEEMNADKKLSAIAEKSVLVEAERFAQEEDEDESETPKSPRTANKSRSQSAIQRMAIASLMAASLFSASAQAESNPRQAQENEKQSAAYENDNSGKNARDVNENRKTADGQALGGGDINVLAEIRKHVVANDALSTNAKNVKILVENGVVTLRGPVKTAEEKTWIQQEAMTIAKGYRVDNQLEVAPG